jgi:hypothetical protein
MSKRIPNAPPTKVSGIDTRNHTPTMMKYIPMGTAPVVPEIERYMFLELMSLTPGHDHAVY